jgi:hypothetical protein
MMSPTRSKFVVGHILVQLYNICLCVCSVKCGLVIMQKSLRLYVSSASQIGE